MRYYFFILLFSVCLAAPALASLSFDEEIVDAADRGATGEVSRLLESGISANVEGKFGTTALMRAAIAGNAELTEILLERGAQPDKADIGGATALHLAARLGHAKVAQILLRYGASINASDAEGWTPLMRAVQNNNPVVAKALIDAKANLKAKNDDGQSLVSLGVLSGNPEMLKLLLDAGADSTDIAQAHDYALQRKNADMVALLEEASGRGGKLITQPERYDDYGAEQETAIVHPVNIPESSPAEMAASVIPSTVADVPLHIVEESKTASPTPYYFLELGKGKTPWDIEKQLEVIGNALHPGLMGALYLLTTKEYYGRSTFRIRSEAYTDKHIAHEDCLHLRAVDIKCKVIQTYLLPEKIDIRESAVVPGDPTDILPSTVTEAPLAPLLPLVSAPEAPVVSTPSVEFSNSKAPHSLLPDTLRQQGDNAPDYRVQISGFSDVVAAKQYWTLLYNKEKLEGVHSEVVDKSVPGSPSKNISVFVQNVPSLYTAVRICSTARSDKFQCVSIGEQ
jgi:hypothetical protein